MRASRQRTVIRRVDAGTRWRFWLAWAALLLLLFAVGVGVGRYVSLPVGVPLEDPMEALQASITRLETRAEVDRATISALRRDIAEAQVQIEELERELVFYRGVMAPEEQDSPLIVRPPIFLPGDTESLWRYQLVVQQGARAESARQGDLWVSFLSAGDATVEAEAVEYRLDELDPTLGGDALTLNFRYFQKIEGELQLPEGFVPERVVLTVRLSKPKSDDIRRVFAWKDVSNRP
jgi:hypothetical protein